MYNYPQDQVEGYLKWLDEEVEEIAIDAKFVELSSPVNFGEIYEYASRYLNSLDEQEREQLAILLSPGTPAMQAVWILLGKTRFPATFYQSSREQGAHTVEIPFEIAAEYIPPVKSLSAGQLQTLSNTNPPDNAAFKDIVTRSDAMQALIQRAQILAEHEVSVLIDGESGTGKELFARAIHNASPRADKSFIPVNCGAFPPELIDSMLFGHKKGAFTGAIADKPGYFEQANGGTLFLDEFGELEPAVQVRLLRVLQDKTFTRVGDTKEQTSDFRLIAATNKNLIEDIAKGDFREDLFYRIAVGVLHLPPLRERNGDVLFLADSLLDAMKMEYLLLEGKKISASGKSVIQKHRWPGNIRELKSTLLRAALWASGNEITGDDMQQALFKTASKQDSIMARDVAQGLDIQALLDEVESHYVKQALQHSAGQKTKAAELLGYNNHQTLSNKMKKLGISAES
ncbi:MULTISPECIES: sigma-54-dependent Fis family transcriptional regulator [unclassified Oceanobacter]|uniref:sigma-54 interaction domain-containing protein n=1 Tax=unclassified Oceanobacter TaxID=2620260 RepID=UPI002736CCCA|nr:MULTISPECIES: sigma-54 dependent transcriptional regulator [unclassified Oceanobacter]MDP2506982.1 sigma-54 dependent transcriptional regulator [Oceanobacter sp. 3_MG-2023]MDP2549446.1 sigma-54 dependent transcriptional regulator [Oceanobacter sp. 4_MG-2023]